MADYPNALETLTISGVAPDSAPIKRICTFRDSELKVTAGTIDVVLTHATAPTKTAMVDSAFQAGWSGTVSASGDGRGFDVSFTTHPDLEPGTWTVTVTADADTHRTGVDSWTFYVKAKPSITGVVPVGRRKVEIVFDHAVRVRKDGTLVPEPDDRYTPIDWMNVDGSPQSYDAANPANYTITRPSTGDKVLPGEAVELDVVRVDENTNYSYVSGNVVYSTRIVLTLDYDQTAKASYELATANLRSYDDLAMDADTTAFRGIAVSQVQRNTITLYYDALSRVHRKLDRITANGDLELFMRCIQEVFDRLLEDNDAFVYELCDPDRMRGEFLDVLLYDLGNPFSSFVRSLTDNKKRKLAQMLVPIYKQKGLCKGIKNVVRFFLGVDAITGCEAGWDDHWILGVSKLGVDTILGPGTLYDALSFWLVTSVVLTATEREQITEIAEYMKPAQTHFRGFVEPIP